MKIPFTKMQGLGNDFVVFDATKTPLTLEPSQIRSIADRRFGVGCDQILVVHPASREGIDFRYQIFNADGAEVENCGNGARCFVRFVRDHGLSKKRTIRVETLGGEMLLTALDSGLVTVDMGIPDLNAKRLPMIAPTDSPQQSIDIDGESLQLTVVSMGNPHAVQIVTHLDTAPVTEQGPKIEHHPAFPKRVNAGYLELVSPHAIKLRVWERGAGETLACGTGACAAVVAGIVANSLLSPVTVHTRGGDLSIAWDGPGTPVMMTGPAETSFEGTLELHPITRTPA